MPQSLPEAAVIPQPRRRSAVAAPPLRYSVAGPGGDGLSPHLNRHGAFIGRDMPLLAADPASPGAFRARPQADLELLLSLGYARRVDLTARMPLLNDTAAALSKGDLVRAAFAFATARLPAFPDEAHASCVALADNLLSLARLFGADLAKAHFNRDEPRVPKGNWDGGRWTAEGSGGDGAKGEAGIQSGRVILASDVRVLPERRGPQRKDVFVSEGKGATKGYVPDKKAGENDKSGVTIAHGFDIGQRSTTDIDNLGLPAELAAKLKLYVGKKGDVARAYLADHPLNISKKDVKTIDDAVFNQNVSIFGKRYNAALKEQHGNTMPKFEELPVDIQTAMISVSYQWGPNFGGPKSYPIRQQFWHQVIDQDWSGAEATLRDSGTRKYSIRRNREANFLRSGAREIKNRGKEI